jgi:GxxExxY protein
MPQVKASKEKIIYPKLSYKITGLLFKTHNSLGRYRNEKQYADYFGELLKENRMNYKRETPLPCSFLGEKARRNIPDSIIEDRIILEIKASRLITKEIIIR